MKNFEEFQNLEYERVAEAHFKTSDAISSFFRYYLIIMSLPATATALFLSADGRHKQEVLRNLTSQAEMAVGLLLIALASVGVCLMLYLLNLRMDGILYARTVNAIRKYFYDAADTHIAIKQRLRVLPQTPLRPLYLELRYFGPVVFTFLLFNTIYFFVGFSLVNHSTFGDYLPFDGLLPWSFISTPLLFAVLHLLFYWSWARYREHGYLQTNAIGIDIDGVLNTHREHFCEVLKDKTGKNISPDKIKRIPVSDNPGLGVTQCDEFAVFHDPRYWTEMPPMDGAANSLQKFRNELNMKIYIFSYRPWPVPVDGCNRNSEFNIMDWKKALNTIREQTSLSTHLKNSENPEKPCGVPREPLWYLRNLLENLASDCFRRFYVWFQCSHLIDRITHVWLYKNHFQYDRLIIEKGHRNIASPNAKFVNRFNMARSHNIRFFIEDDLEKAVKMAYICDVVFLLEHPYNNLSKLKKEIRTSFGKLPANILPVKTWAEIYRAVRVLS